MQQMHKHRKKCLIICINFWLVKFDFLQKKNNNKRMKRMEFFQTQEILEDLEEVELEQVEEQALKKEKDP